MRARDLAEEKANYTRRAKMCTRAEAAAKLHLAGVLLNGSVCCYGEGTLAACLHALALKGLRSQRIFVPPLCISMRGIHTVGECARCAEMWGEIQST
jgi:hypothetical protein